MHGSCLGKERRITKEKEGIEREGGKLVRKRKVSYEGLSIRTAIACHKFDVGRSAFLTLVSFSSRWTLTIRMASEHGLNARSSILTTRHPALALFAQLTDKSVLTVAPEAGFVISEYAELLVVARTGTTGVWAYRYLVA